MLHVEAEDVVAFGDSENDIEMLDYVGMGVCMGDGKDTVKAHADYITAATYDDGIWKGLQHLGIL